MLRLPLVIAALLLAACTSNKNTVLTDPQECLPDLMIGTFEDDYGVTYRIDQTSWRMGSDYLFAIKKCFPSNQYLIAQNHAGNPDGARLWSRIDWILLTDQGVYKWAFCLSAYDAESAVEAESAEIADRLNPKEGCNGFPFSRMKRMDSRNLRHSG